MGKSTLTAIKAVHRALTSQSLIIVVSPCERQSGEFVRKAAQFVSKLGIRPRGDGGNATSLLFPNCIPKNFLDDERNELGDRWFRQEYLCEFLAAEEALFDMDLVRSRLTDCEPLFPGGVWPQ